VISDPNQPVVHWEVSSAEPLNSESNARFQGPESLPTGSRDPEATLVVVVLVVGVVVVVLVVGVLLVTILLESPAFVFVNSEREAALAFKLLATAALLEALLLAFEASAFLAILEVPVVAFETLAVVVARAC
jgi:hypothetical protein